jgi:hypothetical protein
VSSSSWGKLRGNVADQRFAKAEIRCINRIVLRVFRDAFTFKGIG